MPIHSLSVPLEIFPFTQSSSYLKARPPLELSFTFVFLITFESASCIVTSGNCPHDWLLVSQRTGDSSTALHLPNVLKLRGYCYAFHLPLSFIPPLIERKIIAVWVKKCTSLNVLTLLLCVSTLLVLAEKCPVTMPGTPSQMDEP